jgi:flagellar basal body rod protein FlgB
MTKILVRSLSLLILIFLFGCSTVTPSNSDTPSSKALEGKWFGEAFQPAINAQAKWLMNRRNDGTFQITFAKYDEKQKLISKQTEEGTWSYQAYLYATATTKIDGEAVDVKDESYQDLYEIEDFSEGGMKYRHLKSGQLFQSKRVPNDFKLPE